MPDTLLTPIKSALVARDDEPAHAVSEPGSSATRGRVSIAGKFFRLGDRRWHLKGLTYGPFAPGAQSRFLPETEVMHADFRAMRALGANCVRLYHPPDRSVLDAALEHDLRVFVDVPWDKHRCFFEDYSSQQEARRRIDLVARELGDHAGLLGISVANEFPPDVTRFYGQARMARFVDELIDVVKQRAPDCLATFASFPSIEFLNPSRRDFFCFNVYLNDPASLAAYLDHLQHLAGPTPLVLGEYGLDSMRNGESAQADAIAGHVETVFGQGLAGSFVFAFTDDWFTGGHQIENWAFGLTRRDRSLKPAAARLKKAWARGPFASSAPSPRVSIVVCSYNGAATLRACLDSLLQLDYPDYEVILVDDGSTDQTPQIARDFPGVRCIRQENRGLSVARNVGAHAADGEIVAYLDSDCVAERDWLRYLVAGMQRQQVNVIGGPNLPPPADSWIARCIAVSPGAPSHVMLDEQHAEHVPGCNMAFRRETLLALGGFDAQFRTAGDDVDICWRFLDAGMNIGYAPAAVVWHHRRQSVTAYVKQQKGYGRSEGTLFYKHSWRFNQLGCSQWKGVIYGDGSIAPRTSAWKTHHGRHGSGLFQTVYAGNHHSVWSYFTLLEWHALAALILIYAPLFPALAAVSACMWILTLIAAARSTASSPLPRSAPLWCRPLVLWLHVLQPIVRGWSRYRYRFDAKRLPKMTRSGDEEAICFKRISGRQRDVYWSSENACGREQLLESLVAQARGACWRGVYHDEWAPWDLCLFGDRWNNLRMVTATEELGGSKRFTRLRATARPDTFTRLVFLALASQLVAAVATGHFALAGLPALGLVFLQIRVVLSRRKCFERLAILLGRAARDAGLKLVSAGASTT